MNLTIQTWKHLWTLLKNIWQILCRVLLFNLQIFQCKCMLSDIWSVKFNMVEESLMIWIENYLMHMVKITSKMEFSEMNMSSLKSWTKVEVEESERDSSIRSLPTKFQKSKNIMNILLQFQQLITQKYSDYMWMQISLLD